MVLFKDPRRIVLLQQLQQHGPLTARALGEIHGASPQTTTWHLTALRDAGFVKVVDEVPVRRVTAYVWAVVAGVDWRAAAADVNALKRDRS